MNKNTIIGFVLIGVIMFGFTWFTAKQQEKQRIAQAQIDSVARVEELARQAEDSAYAAMHPVDTSAAAAILDSTAVSSDSKVSIYKDSLLASAADVEAEYYTLSNDKIEVAFSTKGAQPYSAKVKDYRNYDSTDLYIFKPGGSEFNINVYAGQNLDTKNFNFTVVEHSDTSIVMRLPFTGGGYIQQKYSLKEDSYMVDNVLSFVGMGNVIPRNVSCYDIDWTVTIPRMEKGYKNESQYSKVDWYFDGEKKPYEMGRGRNGSKRIDNRLSWFAFQQQFFSAIMTAQNQFASGNIAVEFQGEDNEEHNLMVCEAQMREDFRIEDEVNVPYSFYFGPNSFKELKSYDKKYEKIIPLGGWLVGWFTRFVIIPLFDFLHRFISNFGIIILLMTIFIKLVVLPFAYKSYSSSAKMQAIKPEIDKLNEKYPDQEDAMKKQQATMDLYKRAGINPMGGCLPMLLQFPILWAMFRFFPASIELRQQHFLWAEDLSTYDSILNFGGHVPLLGDHVSLFALLMAVSMYFYSKITTATQTTGNDPNAQMMKFMSVWMMPIMMYFICNSLSSGLSYYYLLSNLITMLETFVIKKFFVNPDEIQKRLKESAGKPAQKSKWQQRLEEAQKMQQQALKEQQRKQGRR